MKRRVCSSPIGTPQDDPATASPVIHSRVKIKGVSLAVNSHNFHTEQAGAEAGCSVSDKTPASVEELSKLTTSVLVIFASRSVKLSPHCDWSAESSCRPQIAAPTLPVAIMDGGYMAKVKSAWGEGDHT